VFKNHKNAAGIVALYCNPSYTGCIEREDPSLRPVMGKNVCDSIWKITKDKIVGVRV
jgi:hypothetical protein